jgi:hypothetical protein
MSIGYHKHKIIKRLKINESLILISDTHKIKITGHETYN